METVSLTYVGPFDEAEIMATNQVCKPGESVDVEVGVAGRAPSGAPGDEDFDPGEGLLAQPSNWVLAGAADAPKKRPKKTDEDADPRVLDLTDKDGE